jgi:alanyl-tRNA synthetase
MNANEIRNIFLDFFKSKNHTIVPSAPIVVKNDPTLMFTNAGMNQFKDYFLGNAKSPSPRIADTQKCLRVSGKHNDLEEVGIDTYHHTMFEMLGNWSFGDYFKKEAIEWAWELLTSEKYFGFDKSRLYVTIFEGDKKEKLDRDDEAFNEWKKWIAEDRILNGNKKDNFWEMGDTGPCGPCTEIHCDTRSDDDRKKIDGKTLVNASDPNVIEIWNLVFIQFNRKSDNSLEPLPAKHVDTGMGFERLVRVLQNKRSNYDTDIFQPLIKFVEEKTNIKYGANEKSDIAMRVLADHIRAVSFTIADGQIPSNTGAGYVIRRILRRAVRYYYTYLNRKKPLLNELLFVFADQMKNIFPELNAQKDFVNKVIFEEETAFLKTLNSGLQRIYNYEKEILFKQLSSKATELGVESEVNYLRNNYRYDIYFPQIEKAICACEDRDDWNDFLFKTGWDLGKADGIVLALTKFSKFCNGELNHLQGFEFFPRIINFKKIIEGKVAFELYDTFGFPIDLTELIARENGFTVDVEGFNSEMQKQKDRSRKASAIETSDWIVVNDGNKVQFVGYDNFESKAKVLKYRKQKLKDKEQIQLVIDKTPFYAESGGQIGDTGILKFANEDVEVLDTKKENDLIIHYVNKIPAEVNSLVSALVNNERRIDIRNNHSATHLLHAALRYVLGKHVQQKGSLVAPEHLRFDFSHFTKMTDDELKQVEEIVNEKIRENIPVIIKEMPKDEAIKLGAMALFGEKYGDVVRVVIIDPEYSIELCGGTHVGNTGEIGFFKITSESAIAAGIRRIEAMTGKGAEQLIQNTFHQLTTINQQLKNPKDTLAGVEKLVEENQQLKKQLEELSVKQINFTKEKLKHEIVKIKDLSFIGSIVDLSSAEELKKLAYDLKNEIDNLVFVGGISVNGKVQLCVMITDDLVKNKNLNAVQIIKSISKHINGGGGGQPFFASAGGTNPAGLQAAIDAAVEMI